RDAIAHDGTIIDVRPDALAPQPGRELHLHHLALRTFAPAQQDAAREVPEDGEPQKKSDAAEDETDGIAGHRHLHAGHGTGARAQRATKASATGGRMIRIRATSA